MRHHARTRRLGRPGLVPDLPRPAWVVLGGDFASAVGSGLTLLNLATPIAGQGRRAEAVTVAARAEAILADRLPAGHPHIQAARDALDHLRSTS